jgi:hypothetical protein
MFYQIMLYTVMFFLFVATSFARPQEPQTDRRPTHASLVKVANWVSANFDLPYSEEMPRVEFVPPTQMHRLRYKGMLPQQPQSLVVGGEHSTPLPSTQRQIVALYDDETGTIYLPEGWTGESPVEQSVLVHEMVHHLQNRAGVKYECGGAREKPAYLAQARWLENHGLKLEDEMQVDMFTIIAMSACMS